MNYQPGSVRENVSVCSSLLVKMNCNSRGMSESGSSGLTSGKLVLPIVPRNPNSTLVSDAMGIPNSLLLSSDDLFLEWLRVKTGAGAGPSRELGPLREILFGRRPNVEDGTWEGSFPSDGVLGLNSVVFVSGELLVLFGLLDTLFLGGCRGWKTGGGSKGIGGLKVRLWVGRAEGRGALTFLIGETFQLRSSQGEMCWPTKCSLPLRGFFISTGAASNLGLVFFLAAYGRRDATEDVVLARLRRPIRNGLPVAVLRRLACVNGLSKVVVDSRLASERWTEVNGEISGVHGVASKSSRLISEARSSVAASRRDIDIAP